MTNLIFGFPLANTYYKNSARLLLGPEAMFNARSYKYLVVSMGVVNFFIDFNVTIIVKKMKQFRADLMRMQACPLAWLDRCQIDRAALVSYEHLYNTPRPNRSDGFGFFVHLIHI